MTAVTDTLPASLAFLHDAAHLLAMASPRSAAHLISQRNTVLNANNIAITDTQRQHTCTSCGHIMVPGHGDSLKLEAQRALRKQRNKTHTPAKKKSNSPKSSTSARVRKRLECSMCDSYTDIKTNTAPPVVRRRTAALTIKSEASVASAIPPVSSGAVSASSSASPAVTPAEAVKGSVNASSKKRAKSRKQGLQALLQQSRSSAPQSGLGLSLADFMKK